MVDELMQISVRLSLEEREELKRQAQAKGISLNKLCRLRLGLPISNSGRTLVEVFASEEGESEAGFHVL